ncbi:glutathione peroxidase [Stylonychia lemnae]|uniref:Glutathione peroxidase n=1 Tax=Stylonychia lemnae TaxID=5949 RepID=A0A078B4W0_STYLE|nr:glutathione peroxidase [Stylonychia lemnae]|eukprot:CDW89565.1 glutathione peroxidase [Stylonychia lemnae]
MSEKHYEQMVQMHNKYKEQGFEILAFPVNQFFSQEPGTNQQIKSLVRNFWEAEFPLLDKSECNGINTSEVFKFLRLNCAELNEPEKDQVKRIPWNFSKFLVNKEGQVVNYFEPVIEPINLTKTIENMLTEAD